MANEDTYEGLLVIGGQGHGYLRLSENSYASSYDDIWVSPEQIRNYSLRQADRIAFYPRGFFFRGFHGFSERARGSEREPRVGGTGPRALSGLEHPASVCAGHWCIAAPRRRPIVRFGESPPFRDTGTSVSWGGWVDGTR